MKFQSVSSTVQSTHAQTDAQTEQVQGQAQAQVTVEAEKGIVVVASSSKSAWSWTQHTTSLSKIAFGFVVGSAVIFGGLVGWLVQWATNKRSKATADYGKAFILKGDE